MRAPPKRSWKAPATLTPGTSLVGTDPTPPAALALLLTADDWPVQVGATLWACPGHAVEANTTGLTSRRVSVLVPPACRYTALWMTRCGSDDLQNQTKQLPHQHASLNGGGYTGAAVSSQASGASGTEIYCQTHATLPQTSVAITRTGQQVNDAPTGQIDRALRVVEQLAPRIEVYELTRVAGWCVQFWQRSADLEAL